jgi:hypothetical protein
LRSQFRISEYCKLGIRGVEWGEKIYIPHSAFRNLY